MSDPTRTQQPPATGSDAESRAPDATLPRAPGAPVPGSALGPPKHGDELGTLGRYRVLQQLGAGGMGAVYLGYDDKLARKVALKVMLADAAADSAARERFLREARTAAQVKSDHVVTIHDVDEAGGVPFIAMEYLIGAPLDAYLKKKGELPLGQAVRIVRECALGLAAVHAQGLIHRDIKPGNIWLEAPHGRAKLLDFGLARAESDAGDITGTGGVVGTVAYMSPQQGRGEKVDARTDLWSLGVVLYRLCTGRMPFAGESQMAVLTSIAIDAPLAPRAVNPQTPPALEALILKLLAKDPAARYQTAQEVADALAAVERGEVPAVVAVPVPQSLAVSAQTQNVWESIADDSHSVAVPLADGDATEATRASAPRYRRAVPRQIQIGCMITVPLCLLIGLGVAVNRAKNTPGEEVAVVPKDDTPRPRPAPPNPPKTKGKEPDPKGVEGPTVGERVYPLPPDLIAPMTPLKPEKVFSLDWLDPAKHVPADERYEWHPKELVALIGSHRQRADGALSWVRVSPDGAFAFAGASAWSRKFDLKTGRVTDGPPVEFVSEDFRRGAHGHKVYDLTAPNAPPVAYLTVGHVRAFLTDDLVLAVNNNLFAVRKLDGKGNAEVVESYPDALHFALSPDRKYLALVFKDGTCRVYDVQPTGAKEKLALPGTVALRNPLFSATGVLAAIETGSNLRAWDVSGAKPELRAKLPFSNAIHLTQSGSHLVAPGHGDFELYAVHEKAESWNSARVEGNVSAVASTRDGSQIVTAHLTGEVRVWERVKGVLKESKSVPPRHLVVSQYTDLSPDGRFATVDKRSHSVLLDFTDLSERALPAPGDFQRFSANGAKLFTGGKDGLYVRGVLDVVPGNPFADRFSPLCGSPDGKWLAAASATDLGIWDVTATPPKELWKAAGISASRADFTPDGQYLITRIGSDVRVWAMTKSGPQMRYITSNLPPNWDTILSPDGRTLAWCHPGQSEKFRVEDGVPKHQGVLKPPANTYAYSPNGRALLAATATDVKLVSALTGELLYQAATRGVPNGARFHPDGKHLLVTNFDGTTYVLRLPKEVLAALDDPDNKALEYVFSVGGAVSVNVGGEERSVKRFAELPAGAVPYRVSLEYQKSVSPEALAVLRDCRRLVGFNAHSTDIADAALAHVAVHAGLKHLDLHVCPNVTDAGLAQFKNCKQIEHLNLARARQVTDAGLAHFAGCVSLTFLDVRETKVTPGKIAEFAKALPNCKIVHDGGVIEPKPVPKAGADDRETAKYVLQVGGRVRARTATETVPVFKLEELPAGPLAVTYLELTNKDLSDDGWQRITGLRALKELTINGPSFTDARATKFDCPEVEELRITGTKVGDRGLAALVAGKKLRRANVGITPVGDDGAKALAACPDLIDLTLTKTAVTDAGLAHLASAKKLIWLHLNDTAITDASLKHLEGLRALRQLSLRNTPVTEPALKALKLKLHPDCQIEWDKGTVKP